MKYLETKNKKFKEKVLSAPMQPGCYLYMDKTGEVLYVGKAKSLKSRVKSYFMSYPKLESRIQIMLDQAMDVQLITVDSEFEALILENNLIKKYAPKYNVMLRDDKNYSYIKVEKVVKGVRDFPRIRLSRDQDDPNAIYYGPYPNNLPLKNILKRLRRVFPYVSCNRRLVQVSDNPLKIDTNNPTPCLYYHIGLCQAPCASLISKNEYAKNFRNIIKFLDGRKNEIIDDLQKQMDKLSKEFKYEEAAELRDRIRDIKYVTQNVTIGRDVDDIIVDTVKKEQRENAINELIEELGFPADKLKNHEDFKIECYDISNIQGTNAVGAMTVMVDGVLRPDLYRRFKIRTKKTPNDFAMLQEVLSRRFRHFMADQNREDEKDESFSVLPDLIIIDGGKGQLAATFKILSNFGLAALVPIIGLAKREEEIFKVQWQFNEDEWPDLALKRFKRIFLPRKSQSLFLVQRIRDEAHRFGITFHRKLRSKQMVKEIEEKFAKD